MVLQKTPAYLTSSMKNKCLLFKKWALLRGFQLHAYNASSNIFDTLMERVRDNLEKLIVHSKTEGTRQGCYPKRPDQIHHTTPLADNIARHLRNNNNGRGL